MTGCDALRFTPELLAQPTTHEADKPSGMEFEMKVPQTENVGAPATPTLRNRRDVLPEGLTVDPSSGDGLAACSEAQIGWLGGTPQNFSAGGTGMPGSVEDRLAGSGNAADPAQVEGEMFSPTRTKTRSAATLAAVRRRAGPGHGRAR